MGTAGDKVAIRLTQMIRAFNDGKRLTVDEMADEFQVHTRTVQRDLSRFAFLPIEPEEGRYFLADYALGKLSYKDVKHFSSISGIGKLYPRLSDEKISDILNPKTSKALKVNAYSHENLLALSKEFDALGAAVLNRHRVAFVYSKKRREVDPYKLLNNNGIWYLLAVEDGVLKHFTFSKIKQLSIRSEVTFDADSKVLKMIEENTQGWVSQEPIEVTLQIDLEVAEYFLRRELLPQQEVVEKNASHLILKAKVAYEEEVFRMVRYWIPHIRILEPIELQEKLENSLKSYLSY